jgi:hypothetical protein
MVLKHGKRISLSLAVMLGCTWGSSVSFAGVDDLGVYKGSTNVAGVAAFESWLNRPVTYAQEFLADDTWSKIRGENWNLAPWQNSIYQDKFLLTVPMLPKDSTTTLAIGATGAYDSHFVALANTLVNRGMESTVIRIGHEMNGGWFRWTARNGNEANYANYFKKIVTAMRSVPGQNFKFSWCPNLGEGMDLSLVYPGDAYVDFITFDIYDQSWAQNTYPIPAGATEQEKLTRYTNSWNHSIYRAYGLNWFKNFAAQHNKPMAIAEWGLFIRPDGHGGGDNPYFIQKMHDWIAANNVAWHIYFDYFGSDGNHLLTTPELANGGAKFRQLWGVPAVPMRYEAENATGINEVRTYPSGYSGSGFARRWGNGDISWTVNLTQSGTYDFTSRIVDMAGNEGFYVQVDGVTKGTFNAAANDNQYKSFTGSLGALTAGTHTLSIEFYNDTAGVDLNVDYLEIVKR